MKDIILNPSIIIPLFGIGIVYFFVLLRLSSVKWIALTIEKVTIIFFLLLLIKPIIQPLNYLQIDALAGRDKTLSSAALQLGVYLFFIILSKSLFCNFFKSILYLFKDPFIGALLILALLSGFWAETPLISFKYSLVQLFVSLFAAQVVRRNDWSTVETYARWMCLVAAILSILTILALPSIGVGISDFPPFDVRWIGIFPFPIKLGTCMALSVTLWSSHLIYLPKQSQGLKHHLLSFSAIALSFLLLIKAASAQAFFTLIILFGVLTLINLIRKFNPKQIIMIGVLLIFIFIITYLGVTENLEAIFGFFGKDTTLTGRTEFWPQMIDSISKRPLLGYGVQGFWQPWRGDHNPAGHIIAVRGFVPPNGHNGFLDLALETGYCGLTLFLISLVLNIIRSLNLLKRSKPSESVFPLIMITYVIMSNVSETQLFIANYIWFFYVAVAVRLNLNSRSDKVLAT